MALCERVCHCRFLSPLPCSMAGPSPCMSSSRMRLCLLYALPLPVMSTIQAAQCQIATNNSPEVLMDVLSCAAC